MRTWTRRGGFNYAGPGSHFVPTNTAGRAPLFGTVDEGRVALSAYGHIVEETWHWLAQHVPTAELGAWIVMPDHVHGVLTIAPDRAPGPRCKRLGEVVGAFKTVSAKRINAIRGTPGRAVWHRGFHARLITNAAMADAVRQYIAHNPARWRPCGARAE